MRPRFYLSCALAWVAALGLLPACANKGRSLAAASSSAESALAAVPEPDSLIGELNAPHPDVTFRMLRELGGPLASLLPAGLPMLLANALSLPPLVADSFDPSLPVVGALLQGPDVQPAWVIALHVVSGSELVAKLTTGNAAPFRVPSPGELRRLEPAESAAARTALPLSLAVFDNYLLVASSVDALVSAGPYTARMLPRRAPSAVPIALCFGKRALQSKIVPALRGLWASYRTRLAHLDDTDRSAHGGRAPDFGDPAQVILGADAGAESLLSLLDGAAALELDLQPSADHLEATLLLEPNPGSEVQGRLSQLALGNAQSLLTLPLETQFALGLWRSAEERESAGKAAGDDWVRLLGARLTDRDARELRAVLSDWELGRGRVTRYAFLGGDAPGAILVTDVADAARLKRAAPGLLGLLAVPGIRAPLSEYLGQPRVVERSAPPRALAQASRKSLTFAPRTGRKGIPPLSLAWLVEDSTGFAAAGKDADDTLALAVRSAQSEHDTLAKSPLLDSCVQRIGDGAALFAYADAGSLLSSPRSPNTPSAMAPLCLALGRRNESGYLRLEVGQGAIDLALHAAVGF